MKNVALFGHMASGKSTIAAALIESGGYTKGSFAKPLKEIAALAYGPVSKSSMYAIIDGETGKNATVSGRQILQGVGQAMKTFDRHFWLNIFLRTHLGGPYVLEDGRFLFERDALADRDWLIVGVTTPQSIRESRYITLYGRAPTLDEQTHASEMDINTIIQESDVIVQGIDDPYWNAKRILEKAR
jgi:hypothetical protein